MTCIGIEKQLRPWRFLRNCEAVLGRDQEAAVPLHRPSTTTRSPRAAGARFADSQVVKANNTPRGREPRYKLRVPIIHRPAKALAKEQRILMRIAVNPNGQRPVLRREQG